jgi:hypothetical protein
MARTGLAGRTAFAKLCVFVVTRDYFVVGNAWVETPARVALLFSRALIFVCLLYNPVTAVKVLKSMAIHARLSPLRHIRFDNPSHPPPFSLVRCTGTTVSTAGWVSSCCGRPMAPSLCISGALPSAFSPRYCAFTPAFLLSHATPSVRVPAHTFFATR